MQRLRDIIDAAPDEQPERPRFIASRRGARIAEVPITFVERRVGESKISKGVLLESAIMPWRLIGNPDTAQKAPVSRT